MTRTSLPQPHEQRKVEELLVKLSKMKPVFAKPAPIVLGNPAIRAALHSELASLFLDIKKVDETVPTLSRWPFGAWRKTLHPDESMGYCGQLGGAVRLQSKKHFRTINVQWIGQWGLFCRCGTSWNQ